MAASNPPIFHSSGSHSVESTRWFIDAMAGGRSGVVAGWATTIGGATATLAPGSGFVHGGATSTQGSYFCASTGSTTLTPAAWGANNRMDLIVARVRDYNYTFGGVDNGASSLPSAGFALEIVQGANGGAEPTPSGSYMILAQLNLTAGVTAISSVTDRRITAGGAWGEPWGVVGVSVLSGASTTATNAYVDSGCSVTWTAVAGRRYKYSFSGSYNAANTVLGECQLTDGSNSVLRRCLTQGYGTWGEFTMIKQETGIAAGAVTRKIRFGPNGGVGTITLAGGASLSYDLPTLLVEDVGPATL